MGGRFHPKILVFLMTLNTLQPFSLLNADTKPLEFCDT